MADTSTQLILDALTRATTEPSGVLLHGSKAAAGLFATTAAAKQAAQRCKDEGYVQVICTEIKGHALRETCTITEKGLAYLLSQVSPKQILEDLVRAVEARQAQVGDLLAATQQVQTGLEALKAMVEKVLQQMHKPAPAAVGPTVSSNGSETWTAAVMSHLTQWQASGASEDCPLPQLYRRTQQAAPALTIGQFHDGLRRLHDQEQIYLHPWTGPLYDIPEPPYALLTGHQIAYYASLRG